MFLQILLCKVSVKNLRTAPKKKHPEAKFCTYCISKFLLFFLLLESFKYDRKTSTGCSLML